MIHPAPTTKLDSTLARGTLASSTKAFVGVEFPNTNYLMHLILSDPMDVEIGGRMIGKVSVQARRVDVVNTGGRYIEPVIGRPRRVQGRVVSWDDASRMLVVDAGVPIHLELLDD